MNNIEVIMGIVGILLGLVIIMYKNHLSKSHLFVIPKGFGGKSFKEKFGESRGRKLMFIFGLIFLIVGIIFLIVGFLGINLIR